MKPLMIMSCSDVKNQVDGFKPFTDHYAGPMWQQLRAANFPIERIAAISALYGFLEPGRKIHTYNVKMDEERCRRICGTGDSVACLAKAVHQAGSAVVFGGQMYREIALTAERWDKTLAGKVEYATGSYLAQRKQLGEWLRKNS